MGNMEWIQDVEPNFDDINLRVGDMFRVPTVNEDGSTFSILIIIDIGLRGNKPITYKIESGMGQLQQRNVVDNKVDFIKRIIKDKWRPLYGNRGYKLNESDEWEWINDIKSNQDIAQKIADETKIKNGRLYPPSSSLSLSLLLPLLLSYSPLHSFFTEYCKEQYSLNKEESKDTWERYIEIIKDKVNNLNESDEQNIKRIIREEINDFDWVKEIETDLVFGEIYDIKTGNGYYWVPELYLGKEWDEEYNFEYYKFKGLGNSGGSGRKSKPYIKGLIEKGDIRPYDPNWSIKDELTFSDNIEDTLKGNFVIYFKDGVYLDQTTEIQDKLFEMGFSFYSKGPNEYITNKDSDGKIQFFESFNWDTSHPRYKSMPPDQWDQKKILLNKVNKDDINWGTPNPRVEEQKLFITIKEHDATIINGDKYITNDINESNDLIRKELDNKLVEKISNDILNESDELDWIRDTNPLSYEYVNNKGLEFNPPITDDDYWDKVKSSLEAIGCVVDFDIDDWYDSGVGMLGLFVEYGEVIWTTADIRQGSYQEHIDSYADKPVEVIDGRSLFPL